jgi:hypothetical protein
MENIEHSFLSKEKEIDLVITPLVWNKEDLAKELGTKEEFIKAQEKKVEQCFCKSIYNGETKKVENCSCGKCQDSIDKKVVKEPVGVCQYCNEEIFDDEDSEEGHTVSAGDESITMCEACYENLQ